MGESNMSVEQQPKPNVSEQSPNENAGFSSRLAEVRGNSRKIQQSAMARFEQVQSPKPADQLPIKEIAPETVFSQLEVLTQAGSLSPSEFLSQSKEALQASTQLRNQSLSRLKELRDQQQSLKNEVDDNLNVRIEGLSRAKGLRKILSNRQKIRLTSQMTEIQDELAQLESQAEAEKLFDEQIQKQEKPIRQKQEDILITMIGEDVASIRSDYEKLFQDILQDGTIASDIRETYIKQIIMPDVEGSTPDREKLGEFYKAIHDYIDHRDELNVRTSSYRQALESFAAHIGFQAEPLINKEDEEVIKNLTAKIAAEDIRLIIDTARHQLSIYESRNKLDNVIIADSLGPPAYLGEAATKGTFGKEIAKYLNKDERLRWTYDSHSEIQFWQGVNHSSKANEVFADEIKKQDRKFYSVLLDKSLNPEEQRHITPDLLYYPTPDAIRNLVLIAGTGIASENARSAGRTLQMLSKKLDWKALLDEAEKVYPELKTTRTVLESLRSLRQDQGKSDYQGEFGFYPEIQAVSQDLALSIIESEQSNQKLTALASESLTNSSILGILVKRGIITDSEAALLKSAEDILKKTSENVSNPSEFYFVYHLKNSLLVLIKDEQIHSSEQSVENVRRFTELSNVILENQLDNDALSYLSSSEVLNKLLDLSLKSENVNDFLRAFKISPTLTQDHRLREEFCKQFIDKNTSRFFRDLDIAYRGTDEYSYENFILQWDTASLVGDKKITMNRALELPTKAMDIISNPSLFSLAKQLPETFLATDQDTEFLRSMLASYQSNMQNVNFRGITFLVRDNHISRERALELPAKASDIITNPLFSLAMEYPKTFLATDQGTEFFSAMLTSYQSNGENIKLVAKALEKGLMASDLVLAFPQQVPALMQDKMKESRIFVWDNGKTLLKDVSDLKFLNRLVGEFGQKSDPLIRGYQECLKAEVVTTEEKELVLEFAKQFRVVAPATLAGYKEAKQGGYEKVYIAQLTALAEKMTGSGAITDEERKKPYYKDLLRHVYSNNSGQYSSFESNDSCIDRSSDLTGFKINPRYELDLLSQSEIRIKAGETSNPSVQDEVQKPIIGVAEKMNALGHDKEKIQLMLKENIDNALKEIAENSGLQGIDIDSLTSNEEKMFLILTDSIYGTGSIDPKRVKDLVTTYEFATFEDISDYMAGTRDRVSRANNQDYALLCEVGAFYSDRIKEVNRRLVEEAYKNPQIVALMPEYFRKLSQESSLTQKQDKINRLQVERLGASESFVKQLTGVLEKRRGRKYEPEEVKEIIRRYEGVTGGLQEKSSTSQNPQTRAFYGQLRSQRERSFEALRIITGEKADPSKVHLGEINLKQALDTETGIKEGKYDSEQFASYTAQRFIDIFEDERVKIEGELAKFESITGKQREVLYGYISKSKESANARMVGGVCVAGDNPSRNKNTNMWDMPNYFQLVLQEPDTLQCQGLVLLHNFTQDGKRVLAASLNPSSTYLYSVDETAMFNGIMGTLEQFAKDNNIDMITFSQNKTIRTNRTGGQFEKTMDAKIGSVNKKFTFNAPQTFSYSPKYQLQDMDVAWERI